MTGKHIVAFIMRSYVLFNVVLLISACASTKLIEIDKMSNFLNLSEEQLKVIQPKVESIKSIVDNYNADKESLETEVNQLRRSRMGGGGYGGSGGSGGDQSGSREEIQQKIQRLREEASKSQGQVDALVADIRAVLSEEQAEKFEKIELPKLEMPEFGGKSQRGYTGGGRRGGGWSGGGGDPSF
jgi:outer membrane murein-binding lipoprotein Lpp